MNESILNTIKKMLGPSEGYDYFDSDLIVHINTTFLTLYQLGVGPSVCFKIEDETAVWSDFLGDSDTLEAVKTYIYLQVKQIFDPTANGTISQAYDRKSQELEFRLNLEAELTK